MVAICFFNHATDCCIGSGNRRISLPDFNAYIVRKGQALSDYACDPMGWRRKCLVNIAKAGMFSSDRPIAGYDRDTWHLGKQSFLSQDKKLAQHSNSIFAICNSTLLLGH